ncbi:hypothetical protein SNEBB_008952 [Seison nebaliae]|nr:hypothetical protein SNEBB_008952 [Seison nebaliae]
MYPTYHYIRRLCYRSIRRYLTTILVIFITFIIVNNFYSFFLNLGKKSKANILSQPNYLAWDNYFVMHHINRSSSDDTERITFKTFLNSIYSNQLYEHQFQKYGLHKNRYNSDIRNNNIYYLKLHKTGSSTLQSIFLRLSAKNPNLLLAFPNKTLTIHSKYPLGIIGWPYAFSASHIHHFQSMKQSTGVNFDYLRSLVNQPVYSTNILESSHQKRFLKTIYGLPVRWTINKELSGELERKYNILCAHHLNYKNEEVRRVQPNNTYRLTMMREPAKTMESVYTYFHMKMFLRYSKNSKEITRFLEERQRTWRNALDISRLILEKNFNDPTINVDLNRLVDKEKFQKKEENLKANLKMFLLLRNNQLGLMGFFNSTDYYGTSNDHLVKVPSSHKLNNIYGISNERFNEIMERLMEIRSKFDFVAILEYFDESLLLMMDDVKWTLNDIIYESKNERRMKKIKLTSYHQYEMYRWNLIDTIAYDYFRVSLLVRIRQHGIKKMHRRLKNFRVYRHNVRKKCCQILKVASICREDNHCRLNDTSVDYYNSTDEEHLLDVDDMKEDSIGKEFDYVNNCWSLISNESDFLHRLFNEQSRNIKFLENDPHR